MTLASAVARARPSVDHSRWLLVGVSAGWLLIQLAKLLLPPLLPAIIDDLGITLAMAGVLLTVLESTSALAQLPGGQVSDQLDASLVLLGGVAVLTVGLVVFAGVTTYAAVLVGAACFGLGRGLFSVSSRVIISRHFVERRGRALGVFTAAYDVGGILASGVAIVVLARLDWRVPFGAVAVLFVGFFLLYARGSRVSPRLRPVSFGFAATAGRLARSPGQRNAILTYGLFFFTAFGVLNFVPAFLQAKGFSPALASSLFAIYFVVGIATKPVSGDLSDRFSRRLVSATGLATAALTLAALLVAESLVVVVPVLVVLAVGIKAQFPLVDAILLDEAPDDAAGSDLGTAKMLLYGVGSLGPAYAGVAADRFGYAAAFAGFVVCLVAGTGLMVLQVRRRAGT